MFHQSESILSGTWSRLVKGNTFQSIRDPLMIRDQLWIAFLVSFSIEPLEPLR